MVRLLGAHGEADDGVEGGDAQVLGEQGVVCVDAVGVAQAVGCREGGRVGGGTGLAVAEHGGYDYVVAGEGARGEVEGGVYAAAVAGGD